MRVENNNLLKLLGSAHSRLNEAVRKPLEELQKWLAKTAEKGSENAGKAVALINTFKATGNRGSLLAAMDIVPSLAMPPELTEAEEKVNLALGSREQGPEAKAESGDIEINISIKGLIV